MRSNFTIHAPGTGAAPRIPNMREKLLRMHNSLDQKPRSAAACVIEVEGFREQLSEFIRQIPRPTTARRADPLSTRRSRRPRSTSMTPWDCSRGSLKALRASIGEDEADPGEVATRRLQEAMTLCLRAHSTIGAARIAQA